MQRCTSFRARRQSPRRAGRSSPASPRILGSSAGHSAHYPYINHRVHTRQEQGCIQRNITYPGRFNQVRKKSQLHVALLLLSSRRACKGLDGYVQGTVDAAAGIRIDRAPVTCEFKVTLYWFVIAAAYDHDSRVGSCEGFGGNRGQLGDVLLAALPGGSVESQNSSG